ncbi:MAG TPA: DUF1697 domain-containing protein [Candidatus Krumholzibacteria bacterium]|nr:DUF1697 domain-containing protein [Candidatus Krumholzibacteria bacterium]
MPGGDGNVDGVTTRTGKGNAYVALLRGINLGGRRIPMPELAGLFLKAGCTDARTYIASGNVVFGANAALAKKIPDLINAEIKRKYRFDSPVLIRSVDEMTAIAADNPFLKKKCDPKCLHVVFLADTPAGASVAALDPRRSPGDEFVVKGGEIYLHLPHGAAKTKLTNQYFDATLKTVSSGRNWNTVTTLLAMMQG